MSCFAVNSAMASTVITLFSYDVILNGIAFSFMPFMYSAIWVYVLMGNDAAGTYCSEWCTVYQYEGE